LSGKEVVGEVFKDRLTGEADLELIHSRLFCSLLAILVLGEGGGEKSSTTIGAA
jgi:hypothetical protein